MRFSIGNPKLPCIRPCHDCCFSCYTSTARKNNRIDPLMRHQVGQGRILKKACKSCLATRIKIIMAASSSCSWFRSFVRCCCRYWTQKKIQFDDDDDSGTTATDIEKKGDRKQTKKWVGGGGFRSTSHG